MRNISQASLRSVRLRPADGAAQRVALEAYDAVAGSMSQAREALETQQRRSATLRRALLAAAFSGRLTGGSGDDERIEELVET